MDLFSLAARLTLDSSEYERGLGQAEERSSVFADVLKANIITKGVEVCVSGLAKLGNAAAGVFKGAIDSYADYEQLVGGVETLFKDSADTVMKNAEKAYQTAGLSANEYMETVTGFSAALIQSTGRGAQTDLDKLEKNLDAQYDAVKRNWQERIRLTKDANKKASMRYQMEDELKALKEHNKEALKQAEAANQASVTTPKSLAKAAELADLAIQDMSDNANKMGSDMSSIQSAYQGFAKQNYTMLDNLKLGYGGTKEEMQRLLKDAEKLTGKKYKLSSYADIVEAIHAIQTEMGITGTTQLEAEKTISGSIGRLKAAWQNLVTGMGEGDEKKLDKLVDDVVDAAKKVMVNLIPVAENALYGIIHLVEAFVPVLAQELPGIISRLLPVLIDSTVALFSAIGNVLPQIIGSLLGSVKGIFASSLPKLIGELLGSIAGMGLGGKRGIATRVSRMFRQIMVIIDRFVGVIKDFWSQVLQPIVGDVIRLVTRKLPTAVDRFYKQFIKTWKKLKPTISTTISFIADAWNGKVKPILEKVLTYITGPLMIKIGKFMKSVVDFITQKVIPVIKNNLPIVLTIVGSVVAGIAALHIVKKITNIINIVKSVFAVLQANPITVIIGAIVALVGYLVYLYNTSEDFRKKVDEVWTTVKDFFSNIWEKIQEHDWAGIGSMIWEAIKSGFVIVSDWLLKLVLGDDWTPESGWGDAGAKIWQAIKDGFAVVNDWLIKLLMGYDWTPESGWGDVGAKVWGAIKTGFAVVNDWLIKLLLGDEWTPESGWGDVGAKVWNAIKTGFGIASDWLIKLLLGEEEYTPEATWATVGTKIWGKIVEGLSSAVNWLTNLFNGWTEKLNDGTIDFEGIGRTVGDFLFGGIKSAFSTIVSWFKILFGGENDDDPNSVKGGILSINWAGLGISIFNLIGSVFTVIGQYYKGLFESAWNAINDIDWAGLGKSMWGAIKSAFGAVSSWFEDTFREPVNKVIGYINTMITSFEKAYNRIVNAINSILGTNFEQKTFDRLEKIQKKREFGGGQDTTGWGGGRTKKYATGGILSEGQSAFVGEYAPELLRVVGGKAMVTPLSKVPARFPGGGQEVTVPRYSAPKNLNVVLQIKDTEIARVLLPLLDAEEQRIGLNVTKGGAY